MSDNKEPILVEQAIQQWEYMATSDTRLENLNKLGEEGWQFVEGLASIDKPGGVVQKVFMRPKKSSKKKESPYGYSR